MSVLDNIMVGRYHLLKNNHHGSLYQLTGVRREELNIAVRYRGDHRLPRSFSRCARPHRRHAVLYVCAGSCSNRRRCHGAMEPELILLDEPMKWAELRGSEDMARYIVDLNEEFGMNGDDDFPSNDMGVVMDISHRVMVFRFRPQDRGRRSRSRARRSPRQARFILQDR